MPVRWHRVCIFITGVSAFVSAFLLGYSFDTLAPTSMALMYDKNTGKLDCSKTYGATREDHGRWFTGLGTGFYDYRFPVTVEHVLMHSFPGADGPIIESKTSDGVNVYAGISFQYSWRREPHILCALVQKYGVSENAKKFYINFARAAARDAVGEFSVLDLWRQRGNIAARVKAAVKQVIEAEDAIMLNLQLLTLDIPDEIQREVENTTVQSQRVFQLQLQQQGATVAAITRQLQAQQTAEISVISAVAGANATLTQASAEASALNVTVQAEANGYFALKNALNLTNQQLLALVYIDTLLKTPAGDVTVQMPVPAAIPGV